MLEGCLGAVLLRFVRTVGSHGRISCGLFTPYASYK